MADKNNTLILRNQLAIMKALRLLISESGNHFNVNLGQGEQVDLLKAQITTTEEKLDLYARYPGIWDATAK